MGTVADKIKYIDGTKSAIKEAIIKKGVEVDDNLPFRQYADKIKAIEGGGGSGSDTFKAQLLMENVVFSGTLKTEDQVAAEVLPVLQNIVGE